MVHRVSLTGAHPVDPERAPATVVQQVVSRHGGAQLAYYLAILRPHDGEARSLASLTDPGNEPTPLRLLIAANARATLDQDGAEGLLARAIELEPAAANWALYRIAAATIAANRGDEEAVRRLLDTLDKGFVAQFLALAAWNAPDSGTPEGRRQTTRIPGLGHRRRSARRPARPIVARFGACPAGGSRPRRAMWSRPKRRWRAARECREA